MPRLFVALELPDPLKAGLKKAQGGVESAHWQRDDQLHLTLAFMGDIPRHRTSDLMDELERLYFNPFVLQLKGVNKFGKDGRVKTLWAGTHDPSPVQHLHEKIMRALHTLRIRVDERRFIPHVTLARFHRRAEPSVQGWLNAHENLMTDAAAISHFTLFSSHQTDEGRHYRVEARFGPGAGLIGLAEDWDEGPGSRWHDDGRSDWHDDGLRDTGWPGANL